MTKLAALLASPLLAAFAVSGAVASPGAQKAAAEKAIAEQPGQAAAHAGHAPQAKQGGAARQTPTTGGAKLSATLTGAAEVPPADADGAGSFTATLNPGHDQLCYEIKVERIDPATVAHVHEGAVGKNGPPVVTLDAPASGTSKACATVAGDLAAKLLRNPENYYVNVHNATYPNGAVRGQLGK